MDISKLPLRPHFRFGNCFFFSGQVGLKEGQLVSDKMPEQFFQAVSNIKGLLDELRLTIQNVLDVTVFLTEPEDFEVMNAVFVEAFQGHRPARTTVFVKALPLGAKVELKIIATIF